MVNNRPLNKEEMVRELRNVHSDSSDSDYSMDEEEYTDNEALASAVLSDSSDSSDDSDDQDSVCTEVAKDGFTWQVIPASQPSKDRLSQQNILKVQEGPTAYAKARVFKDDPLSSFRILFNESMLRHIQKCTISEGRRVTGDKNWSVTLQELEKFIGLVIARGIRGRNFPIKSLWDSFWGCHIFRKTMALDRFLEIMKFIRFDEKSKRREKLVEDKFCLASLLWNPFIENCQKAFVPSARLTADEQFLPCKAKCKFIQYKTKKPDKFGLKFWILVDVESKYLFNAFPYLGKDEGRKTNDSVPSNVVMKLMKPLFKRGYNVTCNKYVTSVALALQLKKENCTLVGTIPQNGRELPEAAKKVKQVHETVVMKSTNEPCITLTSYQYKKSKSVILLSTLHQVVEVPTENNPKKEPETVLFYKKNKVGVNVLDQMAKRYSVRAASRRWSMYVFYYVLDIALINSWIIYKSVCKSSISRRVFIQKVAETLCGHSPYDETVTMKRPQDEEIESRSKVRRTCSNTKCRNITTEVCAECKQPMCGKCIIRRCLECGSE